MNNNLVYFLVYRKRVGQKLRLKHPTGGLVMEPNKYLYGNPVADFGLAADLCEQRYHCGPHEELIIAEVFCKKERVMAMKLHQLWEDEQHEFLEMMGAG